MCVEGLRFLVLAGVVVALLIASTEPAVAVHESTNHLIFAPIDGSSATDGTGEGTIDYRGGGETSSRWTATFRVAGLQPDAGYVVAVQGRFGEDESPEADAFTEICTFTTDGSGAGGCWYYVVELRRIGVVQLRTGGVDGAVVLQATRDSGGPGSITSVPNRFSPPETPGTPNATPAASPATFNR